MASPSKASPSKARQPARRSLSASRSANRLGSSGWMNELRELPRPASPVSGSANAAMPRVLHPLRVEPPAEYNAPPRMQPLAAGSRSTGNGTENALSKLARRPLNGNPNAKTVKPERMKDYAVLATACRRAGRASSAAQLAFNQALLFENMGEEDAALHCYKDVLRSSLECGDATGEALACNCIGVNLQLRGGPDVSTIGDEAAEGEANEQRLLAEAAVRDAIRYHQQHLSIADVPGRFIAHCNLGLAYQSLGDLDEAAAQHEQALRYAIRMSSLAGESLACAHLGAVKKQADAATAKACTERRLQLARTLRDGQGKGDAYLQLGSLAQSGREWGEAHHYFEQAMRVADLQADRQSSDLARCSVGLVNGNMQFENYLASVAQQ